jgi:hypothetical protein
MTGRLMLMRELFILPSPFVGDQILPNRYAKGAVTTDTSGSGFATWQVASNPVTHLTDSGSARLARHSLPSSDGCLSKGIEVPQRAVMRRNRHRSAVRPMSDWS